MLLFIFLIIRHTSGCKDIPQFGLNIFICTYYHLCFLFGEMSLQVLCSYLSWVLFLLLHYMSSLFFTLDARSLSNIWLASIFYHSVSCLFVPLMVSFALQNLLSLIRSTFVYIALGLTISFSSFPSPYNTVRQKWVT